MNFTTSTTLKYIRVAKILQQFQITRMISKTTMIVSFFALLMLCVVCENEEIRESSEIPLCNHDT